MPYPPRCAIGTLAMVRSGLNQLALINRIFCMLDRLLGCERIGCGSGFIAHFQRKGNPNVLAVHAEAGALRGQGGKPL